MTVLDLKKAERNIEFEVSASLKDELAQKRCYVAELSKKILDKYMAFDDVAAKNVLSIYNLPLINEKLNIIDFQIKSLSVHVIPTIDRAKNQYVHIPRIYKQYNIKPDVFVFVNFSKNFTKGEILGYLTEFDYNSLSVSKNSLLSSDDLMDVILTMKPKEQVFASNSTDTAQELMLAFIENNLSEEGERFFLKYILSDFEARKNYKIFYALNSNFISIAKNNSIEKEELAYDEGEEILEEAMPEKIELFSRSNFLIDKAISKFEEEESDETDDETPEKLASLSHSFYDEAQDDTPADTQDEQDEQEIKQPEQVELLVDAEDNLEDTSSLEEVDVVENDDLHEENALPADEFLLKQDDEEFLLEEGELEPLEEQEEMILDEEETLSEIEEDTQENEPEMILENSDDDADFLDIAEDANFELSDADMSELLDEQSDIPAIEDSTEEVIDEIQQSSQSQEEDLFSLLSDLADETENIQTIAQETPEEISAELLDDIQDDENISYDNIEVLEQENQQQVFEQSFVEQPEAQIAFANDNSNENPVSDNVQFYQQSPVAKKSSAPLLMALVIISMAGYGLYTYKDLIMEKVAFISGAQDLPKEDLLLENTVIPPVVTQQNENTEVQNQEAVSQPVQEDAKDATPPVAVENVQKGQNTTAEKIPPATSAPALPALPTTVEPPKPKNLNDAIANALSKDFNGVRISKVSWEVSETLVANPEVKRYLTIAGKSIKNSLAQDLMAATEPSFKDFVKIGITYRKDGSISKVNIDASSGSKQIDDIVLKSVKDTLNFVKMPSLNINKAEYTTYLTVGL